MQGRCFSLKKSENEQKCRFRRWCERWDLLFACSGSKSEQLSAKTRTPCCDHTESVVFRQSRAKRSFAKSHRKQKKQVALFWCERWDLNPHSVTNTPLKRARLPFRHARIKIFFIIHKKNLVVNKNYQNYHKQQIFNMMITIKGAKWR